MAAALNRGWSLMNCVIRVALEHAVKRFVRCAWYGACTGNGNASGHESAWSRKRRTCPASIPGDSKDIFDIRSTSTRPEVYWQKDQILVFPMGSFHQVNKHSSTRTLNAACEMAALKHQHLCLHKHAVVWHPTAVVTCHHHAQHTRSNVRSRETVCRVRCAASA